MTIRLLSSQDATAYQNLRLRALRESPTAFSSSYAEEKARTTDEIAARITPTADGSVCVLGAVADESLVGFIAVIHSQREKLRHGIELAGMYVAPEYRCRGFGRELLHAAIARARALDGVRQIKLGVNASNAGAVALYRSAGFIPFGKEPDALFVDGVYHAEEFYVLRFGAAS